jgi:hypothetical protein
MFNIYRQPDLWQPEPLTVRQPTPEAHADQALHDAYEALNTAHERYQRLLYQRIAHRGLASDEIGAVVSAASAECRLAALGAAYQAAADHYYCAVRGEWRDPSGMQRWEFHPRRRIREILEGENGNGNDSGNGRDATHGSHTGQPAGRG